MASFDLDAFLPYQLDVLAAQVSRDFAAHYTQAYGISVAEWRVVAHLSQEDHVSIREICARVNMEKSRVSRAASRLQRAGYVTKSANPRDKRLVTLSLSASGRQMIDDLAPVAARFESQAIARLGEAGPRFREMVAQLIAGDGRS